MAKGKRAFDNYSKKMFSSKVIPTSLALMLTLNKKFSIDVHKVITNQRVYNGNHLFAAFCKYIHGRTWNKIHVNIYRIYIYTLLTLY